MPLVLECRAKHLAAPVLGANRRGVIVFGSTFVAQLRAFCAMGFQGAMRLHRDVAHHAKQAIRKARRAQEAFEP